MEIENSIYIRENSKKIGGEIEKIQKQYIIDNFNSKKLNVLLYRFLEYFQIQPQKQINRKISKRFLQNSSNIILLLSHIKLYKNKLIQKQNQIINRFFQYVTQNQIFINNNINSYYNKVDLQNNQQINNKRVHTQYNKKQHQKQGLVPRNKINTHIKLHYIDMGCKVLNIFNYRLKDLNLIIVYLDQMIKKYIKNNKSTYSIQKTYQEFNKLSNVIVNQINIVKYVIQYHQCAYDPNKQQKELTSKKIYQQQSIYCNSNSNRKDKVQKLKQDQGRYSAISKQLPTKVKNYKQPYPYLTKKKKINTINTNNNKTDFTYDQSYDYNGQQNSINRYYLLNSGMNNSHRSILKTTKSKMLNKYAYQNTQKKRTSIQYFTDTFDTEAESKQLKLTHLDQIQGNDQKICQKDKNKKHVQIQADVDDIDQMSACSISDDKQVSVKSLIGFTDKIGINRPTMGEMSKNKKICSKRKFTKQIKLDSQVSISSFKGKRYQSFQDLPSWKINKMKRSKINSINTKKTKKTSIKNKKDKGMTTSLTKIINENDKNEIKKQQNLPQNKQQQSSQNTNILKKLLHNNKNNIKNNHKILNKQKNKQKYNIINQTISKQTTQKISSNEQTKKIRNSNDIKLNRRMGITINSFTNQLKVLASNIQKQNSSSKNQSQITSNMNLGSKKFYKSNKRIKCYQDQDLLNLSKPKPKKQPKVVVKQLIIPSQFKVRMNDRLSLPTNYIKFHPNIECTLYKTTKQYEKQLDYIKYIQTCTTNINLSMDPIPNFYVSKQIQNQCAINKKQIYIKKSIFDQDNMKIYFCQQFVHKFNQLSQKNLCQCWDGNNQESDHFYKDLSMKM